MEAGIESAASSAFNQTTSPPGDGQIGEGIRAGIYISLAIYILLGYICSRVFWVLRLPPVLGMLVCGILLVQVEQLCQFLHPVAYDYLQASQKFSPLLQDMTFFLVLVRAGLEIEFEDLTLVHALFGVLPVIFDAVGIGIAAWVSGIVRSIMEAACVGVVMSSLGDGLVIPKMMELRVRFPKHARVPSLMFIAAPIEATMVLTLFGACLSLASPTKLSVGVRLGVVALRFAATVALSKLVTFLLAGLMRPDMEAHSRCVIRRRPVLSGQDMEDMIMILGTTFAMYAAARFIPSGFDSGGLLQPELSAILCATFFGNSMSLSRRKAVERILGQVWVVCSLVLFTILGTKVNLGILASRLAQVLPLLLSGLLGRSLIVVVLVLITKHKRTCRGNRCRACLEDNSANWMRDAAFIVLAGVPRATVQGALAYACAQTHAFESYAPRLFAKKEQQEVAEFAICTLAICAPCGVVLLDFLGKRLLRGSRRECPVALSAGDACSPRGTLAHFGPSRFGLSEESLAASRASGRRDSRSIPTTPALDRSRRDSRSIPTTPAQDRRRDSRSVPTTPAQARGQWAPSPVREDSVQEHAESTAVAALSCNSDASFLSADSQDFEASFFELVAGLPPQCFDAPWDSPRHHGAVVTAPAQMADRGRTSGA